MKKQFVDQQKKHVACSFMYCNSKNLLRTIAIRKKNDKNFHKITHFVTFATDNDVCITFFPKTFISVKKKHVCFSFSKFGV